MQPILWPGDVVYFKKISFKKITINDIVFAKKGKAFFVHRVIYINRNYLITKGDNNSNSDGRIYVKQIIAKACKIKRGREIFDIDAAYLFQSTIYFQEIINIKKMLGGKQINFVFLKGLPLHLYFERIHPRRFYADCDLLITASEFDKTRALLEKLGYHKIDTSLSKTQERLTNKEPEISFGKKLNNFRVVFDVHLEPVFLMTKLSQLDFLYPSSLLKKLTEKFLEEKQIVKIQQEPFPILATENLILYLSLHLFHHNFRGAFRYQLIEKILQTKHINWNLFLDTATAYRLKNFIYPGILLLRKYAHVSIPKTVMGKLNPKSLLVAFVSQRLAKEEIFDDESRILAGVKRFLFLFILSPNPALQKILVLSHFQTLFYFFWTIIFFAKSSFNKFRRSSLAFSS